MEFHMMSQKSSDEEKNSLCKICGKHLSLTSERQTSQYNIFKTTHCCNDSIPVHIRCARKFSLVIDKSYNFLTATYSDDDNMRLYCLRCEKPCFCYEKKIYRGR